MRGKIRFLVRFLLFILSLYAFLVSIKLIGIAFNSLNPEFTKTLFTSVSNPLIGLFVGILATSLMQSSSATTSIVVTLVAGGSIGLRGAIPIIMGANIGTSVTNTIVSLGHITRKEEFKRAFSAGTVHDAFNILSVLVFLPLEIRFHIIERGAIIMTELFKNSKGVEFTGPLALIINPVATRFVNIITPLPYSNGILLILSLALLFASLKMMVDFMKSMVFSKVQNFIDSGVFRNASLAFMCGLLITGVIQSSSVTTSLVVPLAGAGILSLEKIFPYTLGANVGTTVTAILASLATISEGDAGTTVTSGLAVAFAHLLFNIFGIVVWYPLRRVPLRITRRFSEVIIQKKRYAILFILIMFYLLPFLIIFTYNLNII